MKQYYDIEKDAANLYDGGWRKEDREELLAEYENLTPETADDICEYLEKFEAKENPEMKDDREVTP